MTRGKDKRKQTPSKGMGIMLDARSYRNVLLYCTSDLQTEIA